MLPAINSIHPWIAAGLFFGALEPVVPDTAETPAGSVETGENEKISRRPANLFYREGRGLKYGYISAHTHTHKRVIQEQESKHTNTHTHTCAALNEMEEDGWNCREGLSQRAFMEICMVHKTAGNDKTEIGREKFGGNPIGECFSLVYVKT